MDDPNTRQPADLADSVRPASGPSLPAGPVPLPPDTSLAAALRSIGDAVITTDVEGRVTYLNDAAETLTGWPLEEAVGRHAREVFCIVNEMSRIPVASPAERVIERGHVVGLANHTVLIARGGREIPVDDSGAPIHDRSGNMAGVVLVFRDISERRASERALQRQAQLLELAHDAVLVHDLDNRIEFWNRAAQDLYGWSRDEAVGAIAYELLCTRFPEPLGTMMSRLKRRGAWEGMLQHRHRDGTERVVSSRWALQRDEDGRPLAVLEINRDVTDREAAEEAVRRSEARYHSLYSAMREGMALHEVVWDQAGHATDYRILDANPAFEAITGLSREQAVGCLASELYGTGEPPFLEIYAGVAQTGEPASFETDFLPMRKAFRISAFRPAPGQFATVFEDITDRRQREDLVVALNARLRRAMRETHHRVKNNLQTIAALIDMQAMRDADTVPASELERLGRHVHGLSAIHDLLTQEARTFGEVELISVRDAMDKLKYMLDALVHGRELRFHIEDARLPVRQATALAVLANELVSNAAKHGAGAIDLSVAVAGDTVALQVRDEGPGFPAGFSPTQAAHTGLELVESVGRWDLQGEIVYGNNPAGGACVTVRFTVQR